MIGIGSMHMWKSLVLKIYFRFARKNSKWPPKTTFSWITREPMDRFSKFQRQMFTIDGMHMWKMLVLKIYFRSARKNSKWPPKTTFSWITRELMDRFSKFQRQMITIDGMHMSNFFLSNSTPGFLQKIEICRREPVLIRMTRDCMDFPISNEIYWLNTSGWIFSVQNWTGTTSIKYISLYLYTHFIPNILHYVI